jgi:peptidoglycan/xylan/chitin deacetylase (PgdA/CDA1 family)
MIGKHILINPTVFLQAFNAGHDIAVHTYNHPYMTTLTNEQIVGQVRLGVPYLVTCADHISF